jgi:hypothetical protein
MDPLKTLMDAHQAVIDGDTAKAVDNLNTYYQWRLKGGYEPHGPIRNATNGDVIADRIATALLDSLS